MKIERWTGAAALVVLVLVTAACARARRPALEPESARFLEHARLIMSREEVEIFSRLPDPAARQEFIREFWEKRDTDLTTEENEFREEFYRRIDYANLHFREGIPGWKTARGRIYIYLGPPDDIDDYPMLNRADVKGAVVWVYANLLAVTFVDERGDGRYELDPRSAVQGNLLWALDRAKFGLAVGRSSRQAVDFDMRYDRGQKQVIVSIPVGSVMFQAKDGLLSADFDFTLHVTDRKTLRREKLQDSRHFEKSEEEVQKIRVVEFAFPLAAAPGAYYLDIVIVINPGGVKTREVFAVSF